MRKRLFPMFSLFFLPVVMTGCVLPIHSHIQNPFASKPTIIQPVHVLSYQSIYKLWSAGKQSDAEEELGKAIEKDSSNQKMIFFAGACVRSRFEVQEACELLAHVVDMNPNSSDGKCAKLIVLIDIGKDQDANFKKLCSFANNHPDNPLYLWMAAVQCRSLNRNQLGVSLYRRLMKKVSVGSSLVHQTFANVLDETGNHSEALIHRRIAVNLEPAAWSYGGLRNTLEDMKRWEDAYSVIQKGHQLFPKDSHFNDLSVQNLPQIPESSRRGLYKQLVNLRGPRNSDPTLQNILDFEDHKKKEFCTAHDLTESQLDAINEEGVYKHW